MTIKYRGTITFDFDGPEPVRNWRTKMAVALTKAGWHYAQTTAYTIDTDDIREVWRGIAIVANGSKKGGTLSAVTFSIIGSSVFSSGTMKPSVHSAASNHPSALDEILNGEPFPLP